VGVYVRYNYTRFSILITYHNILLFITAVTIHYFNIV